MATMNVFLSDGMKRWVDSQATTGQYGDGGDYVRELIRRDQERVARIATMQHLVDEARQGGITALSTDDILDIVRKEANGSR